MENNKNQLNRVLIIDDESYNHLVIKNLIKSKYRMVDVKSAYNGNDGL